MLRNTKRGSPYHRTRLLHKEPLSAPGSKPEIAN